MFGFVNRVLNGRGITSRVFRGGAWLGTATVGEHALRFIRNMILARLLAPEAFGLMAIILSIHSLFQVLTGMWVKESVIQNPRGAEPTYLNAAWFVNLARSSVLYIVAFILAPFIASFYEEPGLTTLIRVAFVCVIFGGMLSPRIFLALKEMKYGRYVLMQQGGGALGILTTIALAFFIKGVWALALGYVAEALYRFALSYIVAPFRPRLQFNREDTQALLSFSKGMFGIPVLMLLYTEGATFFVGKMCTKEMLGIFALTLSLARIPGMFGNMLVELLLPSFAQMASDKERLNQGLLKVTSVIAFGAMPALVVVALFGREILAITYGPLYAAGGVALGLLFLNEMLYTCNVPIASLYVALGRPDLLRRFSLLRALVLIAIIYPAISMFGLVGAAAAPLIAICIGYGFQLHKLRSLTGLATVNYLVIALRSIVFALPILVGWLVVRFVGGATPVITVMICSISGALLLYAAMAYMACRSDVLRALLWPYSPLFGTSGRRP